MLWFMILLLPDLDLPSCAYVLTVLPLQQHKSLRLRYYALLPRVHLHLRQMLLVSTSVRSWSIWDSRQVRIVRVTPSVDFMETLPSLSLFIHVSSSQPSTRGPTRPSSEALNSARDLRVDSGWQVEWGLYGRSCFSMFSEFPSDILLFSCFFQLYPRRHSHIFATKMPGNLVSDVWLWNHTAFDMDHVW